jgi:hypothetical protein
LRNRTWKHYSTQKIKKRDEHTSAGEDFSEVSSTLNSDDELVTQDQWLFPVVSPHSKREEYAAVSHSSFTVYSNELTDDILGS